MTLSRLVGRVYPLVKRSDAPPGPVVVGRTADNDVAVTDYGYRSLTGVAVPFPVNKANLKALEALPGVGKKRAVRLSLKRPFRGPEDVARALDDADVAARLAPLLSYE